MGRFLVATKGTLGDPGECVSCGATWLTAKASGRPRKYCSDICRNAARAAKRARVKAAEPDDDETRNHYTTRATTADFLDAVSDGYRIEPRGGKNATRIGNGTRERRPHGWPDWLVKGQEPAEWPGEWERGPDEGETTPGLGDTLGAMVRPWWQDAPGYVIRRYLNGVKLCEDTRLGGIRTTHDRRLVAA